jgi:sugar lactone lactonase YvrE
MLGAFMKALALLAAFSAALYGQVIRTVPYNLVRLDPALDSVITADSPLEVLGEHFGLTEGPLWIKDANDGYLLFSDCAANVIYKWQPNAPLSVFLEKSGFTGKDNLNVGQQTIAGRPGDFPNGIALSPDEKTLYVTAGFRKTVAYDVLPDDTVANSRTFIEAGNDGMKTDNRGNVFQVNAVGQGEVLITAPDGKRLGTIQLPQIGGEPRPRICASNVAFGDADGKGLYITSCTHLFRVRLKASGLRGER